MIKKYVPIFLFLMGFCSSAKYVKILKSPTPSIFEFTAYAGNPIIQPGGWEGAALAEPSVIYEDGIFKMWYRGAGGIGYATSEDGISFSKYEGNPVLTVEGGIAYPFVLKIGSVYYMYAGKVSIGSIYRWSSSDGIVWTIDNGGDPVLEVATSGWDAGRTLYNTSVYYNESISPKWRMLYEAAGIIGYAYSDDGLSWTRYETYVIAPTGGGVDDWRGGAVYTPSNITKRGDYYYVWYSGENGWMDPWESRIYSIGYAYSTDFIHWIDASNNPVLSPAEYWESFGIGDAHLVFEPAGETYDVYMYYGGGIDNYNSDLGLAYSE